MITRMNDPERLDMCEPGAGNRYLLIARVGANGLQNDWIEPADRRGFDVLLSSYSADIELPAGDGIITEYRQGPKVAGYDAILKEYAELWRSYDFIALFDDDLESNAKSITRMFELCRDYKLKIAQPSLSFKSHASFMGLLQQKGWKLRYVTFVEMMCPIFSREALERALPLFGMGYESGIDLVWCNLMGDAEESCAVLDETPVTHTRPVGSQKSMNGFVGNRNYADDMRSVLASFSIPYVRLQPYSGVDMQGCIVRSRLRLARSAFPLFWRSFARGPRFSRLWSSLVYVGRTLFTRPGNVTIN